MPALCATVHGGWDAGDLEQALGVAGRLVLLDDLLFVGSNPIPIKAALGLLGFCDPIPRLPLIPAKKETMHRLAEVLLQLIAEDELTSPKTCRAA